MICLAGEYSHLLNLYKLQLTYYETSSLQKYSHLLNLYKLQPDLSDLSDLSEI